MTEPTADPSAAKPPEDPKLVPVTESIKYRRRAQQAEGRIEQLEQQLQDLQTQLEGRNEALATAEAQRDEARHLTEQLETQTAVERELNSAGVVDVETASMLLARRVDLEQPLESDQLRQGIEELLSEKPFLLARADGQLPPATSSSRTPAASLTGEIASAAKRAAVSGNRRDVADYLRLRRRAASAGA